MKIQISRRSYIEKVLPVHTTGKKILDSKSTMKSILYTDTSYCLADSCDSPKTLRVRAAGSLGQKNCHGWLLFIKAKVFPECPTVVPKQYLWHCLLQVIVGPAGLFVSSVKAKEQLSLHVI